MDSNVNIMQTENAQCLARIQIAQSERAFIHAGCV